MSELIQLRLREDGLELRKMVAKGAKAADIEKRKTQMLSTVYRILTICLGHTAREVYLDASHSRWQSRRDQDLHAARVLSGFRRQGSEKQRQAREHRDLSFLDKEVS